jgi:hypothetical protein
MTPCCAIRTRYVRVIFSCQRLSLICLEQSYLRHPMVLSGPGSTPSSDPVIVGMLTTSDVSPTGNTQVQLLTLFIHTFRASREQGWVASGSFDHTIKLWDLSRASRATASPPLTTLTPRKRLVPRHRYMRLQSIRRGIRLCLGVRISSACGILEQASALANLLATLIIFTPSSCQRMRDVCVVAPLSPICALISSLTAPHRLG